MKTKGATSGPEAHRLLFEGALALSKMERIGMKLDLAYLDRAIRRCEGKIKKYTEKLKADAVWVKTWNRMRFGKNGTNPPNLDSPQQLAEVLYDRLGFECVKFTEKGSRSTDEEALADIDLSFVRNYVRRKKLEKLLSTYLLNYKKSHIGALGTDEVLYFVEDEGPHGAEHAPRVHPPVDAPDHAGGIVQCGTVKFFQVIGLGPQAVGDDPGDRRLAAARRPDHHQGVIQGAVEQVLLDGRRDVLLPDHVGEGLRAVTVDKFFVALH